MSSLMWRRRLETIGSQITSVQAKIDQVKEMKERVLNCQELRAMDYELLCTEIDRAIVQLTMDIDSEVNQMIRLEKAEKKNSYVLLEKDLRPGQTINTIFYGQLLALIEDIHVELDEEKKSLFVARRRSRYYLMKSHICSYKSQFALVLLSVTTLYLAAYIMFK